MKEWLMWLLLGIVSVVFGVVVLGNTFAASIAITMVTGILFLASGIFQVIAGFSVEGMGSKIFAILIGVLMAFLGGSFISNPLEGTISLALLVVIMLAASGIVRMVFAWRMRSTSYFWPMLLSGVLSVLLAGYIVANFETASVTILGIMMGVELLFNGIGLIVVALFVRTEGRAS